MASLQDTLPWTKTPLIVNAPMAGFAGPSLATAVSQSGGLGLIGGLFSMSDLRKQLQQASETLTSSPNPSITTSALLPLGVGLLPFVLKIEEVLPVISDFKPAVVWLFAAKQLDDYAEWASEIRKASPGSKIWIQVGSVSAAVHVAKTATPDALCMQGADAGGHGFQKGAGIVSLLPEAASTLAKEGFSSVPLLASGGIVDGRGVAAALALGAAGAVMGTRFLASKEVTIHPEYQAAVLEAQDGGQVTARSKLFDELRGPNVWPEAYDGRAMVMQSWRDHANGMGIEEVRRLHNEAVKEADAGFARGGKGRAAIWVGTGLGLVHTVESAADIVESVRQETREVLAKVSKIYA